MESRVRSTILVVDDDPGIRDALHLVLDDEYEVIDAVDGFDALAALASRKIDLMLLDLVMGHGDGFEVLEHRSREPKKLPIIVLSGLNNAWTAATAMRLGAVDYVTKPFDEEDLRDLVRNALTSPSGSPAQTGRPGIQRPAVVLIGLDLGVYASLTVLLGPQCRVARAETVSDALALSRAPSTTLVIDMVSLGQAAAMLPQLCEHFENARLVAIGAGHNLSVPCTLLPAPASVTQLLGAIVGPLATGGSFGGGYTQRVALMIDHLGTHYAEASVRRLARFVGGSPDHLSACFREETGYHLKTYMTGLRIEAAKWLLLEAGEKVEAVAARVGLHDASHLSRLFVRYAGTRPGAYRRSVVPAP
jgi:DNA-binding response OmpR family regulator/AraC-like DNA-binding protein